MRLQFFSISARDGAEATRELNGFLASHRVAAVQQELVHDGANSYWAVSVSVVEGEAGDSSSKKSRIDYREVLSEPDFAVYAKLRFLRKELSERDRVPAYALFTNEHLAAMVTNRVSSLSKMQEIAGVGPTRVDKYGAAFIDLLQSEFGSLSHSDEKIERDS